MDKIFSNQNSKALRLSPNVFKLKMATESQMTLGYSYLWSCVGNLNCIR